MAKKLKTGDSTRKAIEKYNAKFERMTISLPPGTKDRIKTYTGLSVNAFVNQLIEIELHRIEQEKL